MTREEAIVELMSKTTFSREQAEKYVDAYAFIMDYELID